MAFARDITIDQMFSDGFSMCCVFPGVNWFHPVLVRSFLTELSTICRKKLDSASLSSISSIGGYF